MDFNSFINNLRAGVAEADRQANNFINQTGNELGRAFNLGFVQPFQAAGSQIGQLGNQLGQAVVATVAPSQAQTQQTQQPQPNAQLTSATNAQPAQQTQVPTQTNNGQVYLYRDPAIDGFINTLRFMMNPIRGITGWTPLDIIADTASDNMYSTFGKRYIPTSNESKEEKTPDTTETTKPTTEAKLTSADEDVVTYTYKPGDTFGQVILDLGLGTGNGLWGINGDVDYYTKQLIDQGIWSDRIPRNIPIGTTIKLKRRK